MTLRAVIVDDEKPARDRIRRLLADHPDIALVGEAMDVSSAVDLLDREKPDLCFLDVRIPQGDGFEVLRRVASPPRVIFTTAYDEYAVRAFDVHSVDYLLKPFDRQRFAAALDRAREALGRGAAPVAGDVLRLLESLAGARGAIPAPSPSRGKEPPVRIPARRGAKILLLDPEEVRWFEAEETVVFAKTPEGRFLVERTLSDLEELLSSSFFRTHRGYLVNLSQIAEIQPGDAGTYRIVLRDPERSVLPLSRRQAQRLREMIPW